MRIARHYTACLEQPYEGVGFRTLTVFDGGAADARLGDARDAEKTFEFPESWSAESRATFFRRCAAHVGVPAGDRMDFPKTCEHNVPQWLWRSRPPKSARVAGGGESSARQTIDRLAGDLTWWGWKAGYFDAEADAAGFFDELRYMLCHRLAAPELSLWSRAGRHWAYGAAWDDAAMFVTDPTGARAVRADARHAANRSGQPWSAAVFDLRAFLGADGGPGADGGIDAKGLAHAARLWTIALDISIIATAHAEPIDAERDWSARPIALEPANLSSLLLAMGLAHDSDAGRAVCADAMALIAGAAHAASAEMAGELGAAPDAAKPGAAQNAADPLGHIALCARAARNLPESPAAVAARRCWDDALADAARHGMRNLKISVTPSRRDACRFLDTEAAGIEPGFALVRFAAARFGDVHRGGLKKHMNPQILGALGALGYDPPQIEDISRHVVARVAPGFGGAPHIKPDHLPVFDWSRGADGGDRMRRAAQPFLDDPGDNATPIAAHAGVRRGRFMVYDGGAANDQPTQDLPANTTGP